MDEKFLEATEDEQEAFAKMPNTPALPAGVRDCWSAIKAAADAVSDYCGTGALTLPIGIGGVSVSPPPEIWEIAKSELSPDKCIIAIADSNWCRKMAFDLCADMLKVEPGTPEHETCAENTRRMLAETIVGAVAPDWIKELVGVK